MVKSREWTVFLFALAIAALGPLSCERYFDAANDNPNQPEAVSLDMLLPSAQLALAYGNGGDVTRLTALLTQQVTGVSRCGLMARYYVGEPDMDNWWRFNMYAGALMDLQKLQEIAGAEQNRHYLGIGKVLTAYGMMLLTDMFGDAPFSEAFQESENVSPKWDSQESIYEAVFALLGDAVADLEAGNNGVEPGRDDLIYGGDLGKWVKMAHVLVARGRLHLAKVDAENYSLALNALGMEGSDSYGAVAEDARLQFGTAATEAGPVHQFNYQRAEMIYNSGFLYDYMAAEADPRMAVYFSANANSFTGLGDYFDRPDAFFTFISFVEQKFIEAEAAFNTGDLDRAANAHNAAVLASLGKFSLSDPAFELVHAQQTAATIDLEEIMLQKYTALYLEPEVYTDWRRTGFPALTAPPNNATGGIIPRRFPYPQSERLYNSANFLDVPITSRTWWDRE